MLRDDCIRIYSDHPLNVGTVLEQLRQTLITPNEIFFVRNHAEVPIISPDNYQLHLSGLVKQPLRFSLDELRRQFSSHTVTATVQCAGNRRRELVEHEPIDSEEIIWEADAIGTAEWTGVRLCDVLESAGVLESAAHVAFTGLDQIEKSSDVYGGSIPLEKALTPDVLLAYEMNGEPLSPEHGYPLRVIVPGYIGARSVKWLSEIIVQVEPSQNYFQTRAYRLFPPEVRADTAIWEEGIPLAELPINAVICSPQDSEVVSSDSVKVEGFAVAGGDAVIQRVELSWDNGETWHPTRIVSTPQQWAWVFWELECPLTQGSYSLVVRAFDSAGNSQASSLSDVWNFKGYLNNAYHRIEIQVAGDK